MTDAFDLVVVGAGAVGAAVAYHAARAGHRVLLLEQFEIGHTRGSSHGESRIIRHSYTSLDYATLAPAAFEAWRKLEEEAGLSLLTVTGGIDLGPPSAPALVACRDVLSRAGFAFTWLEGDEARRRWPQFNLPAGWAILHQEGAGVLHASRCVRALVDRAAAHGAVVRENARASSIAPGALDQYVSFAQGGEVHEARAAVVVIAAGPWAARFLSDLDAPAEPRVTHQQVAYYPLTDDRLWPAAGSPIYIAHGRDGFYGFPVCERPGFVKVGIELDSEVPDPDVPAPGPDLNALARLNGIVAARLRGIHPEPAEVVTCRYTETPTNDFIVDRHPYHPGIVVASPCSGHGFKFSILTGKLAVELATSAPGTARSPLWRDRFSLAGASSAPAGLIRDSRR